MVGGFDVADVDAFEGARGDSKGDGVVGVDLGDAVRTFEDGFRFFGRREGLAKENLFVDDIVMSYAVVIGSKEAVVDVRLAEVV